MTASRTLGRANRRPLSLLSAALWVVALTAPSYAADRISVALDQATIIHLPDRTANVVIGNPLIADIAYVGQGRPILVDIIGKSFGTTNLIALDRDGAELMKETIEVTFPNEQSIVVVYRGADRQTYSCTPDCSPRLTLGDSDMDKVMTQITSHNSQSAAAGSQTGGH